MPSALHLVTRPAQLAVRRWVTGAFPRDGGGAIDYDSPPGDPGLFHPDGATWRIHADFPGMLSGGLAALMLQTLHPLALAGVWDHSNFRDDLVGRLRRTTTFVGGTTYAPRATAAALHAIGAAGGVLVGGDTGPVRVAAAVGVPVVGLFGPTLASRYGFASAYAVTLQGLPECGYRRPTAITEQPCWWTGGCPLDPAGPACLAGIRVDEVLAAVVQLASRNRSTQ